MTSSSHYFGIPPRFKKFYVSLFLCLFFLEVQAPFIKGYGRGEGTPPISQKNVWITFLISRTPPSNFLSCSHKNLSPFLLLPEMEQTLKKKTVIKSYTTKWVNFQGNLKKFSTFCLRKSSSGGTVPPTNQTPMENPEVVWEGEETMSSQYQRKFSILQKWWWLSKHSGQNGSAFGSVVGRGLWSPLIGYTRFGIPSFETWLIPQ